MFKKTRGFKGIQCLQCFECKSLEQGHLKDPHAMGRCTGVGGATEAKSHPQCLGLGIRALLQCFTQKSPGGRLRLFGDAQAFLVRRHHSTTKEKT